MNHYPRHIGDWMVATAHLTELEECMYSRMLDAYYSREGPLPSEVSAVCRLVRAASAPARKAVDAVLAEFFTLEPEGWRQKRCDEEIARYHEMDEEHAAKREHERERQKRHRERRQELFATLRERGIIPAYNTTTTELERLCHVPVTRDVTRTATTIKPEPEPIAGGRKKTRPVPLPDGFGISERVRAWAEGKDYGALEPYLETFVGRFRANGKKYTDWDQAFMNAIREDWYGIRQLAREAVGPTRSGVAL